MEKKTFYHMFANGDDARNFIISTKDYIFIFNLIGICAYLSNATVVAFSIEDTHPHILLFGTYEQCMLFKRIFEDRALRHIRSARNTSDNVLLDCELLEIKDQDHLRRTAVYVIFQATKDGKAVMPYDYLWGTGSLYFRTNCYFTIWEQTQKARRFADLTTREKRKVSARVPIPDDWKIAGDLILPTNYVDIALFESIYKTHNCFRVFLGASNNQTQIILDSMMENKGIKIEDTEARDICTTLCNEMFQVKDVRKLTAKDRMVLAKELKRVHRMSHRQISSVVRIPETEIRKYM